MAYTLGKTFIIQISAEAIIPEEGFCCAAQLNRFFSNEKHCFFLQNYSEVYSNHC